MVLREDQLLSFRNVLSLRRCKEVSGGLQEGGTATYQVFEEVHSQTLRL
jgi:hypothetical protein